MNQFVQVEIKDGPRVWCECPGQMSVHRGDYCVIEHDGCTEYGLVVSFTEGKTQSQEHEDLGSILRRATLQDQSKAAESSLRTKMALEKCEAKAREHEIDIRIVRGRYSFDRSVLFLVFSAEEKVDTREFNRDVAADLGCKVRDSQIGVRDEAGIIGGIGPCGRNFCCCSWLNKFESINVKMAKRQRMSLSPASIGGCCGRLKCCLKYEYDTYRELDKFLPKIGTKVEGHEGKGKVIDKNILRQTVTVKTEDHRTVEYRGDEVHRSWDFHRHRDNIEPGKGGNKKKDRGG